MIAEVPRKLRLPNRLLGAAGGAGDQHEGTIGPAPRGLHRQAQHRLEQADLAYRELGGMNADCEAAGAGVDIVARKRPLPALVEAAIRGERERMRRNHHAAAKSFEDRRRPVAPTKSHD